MSLLPCFKIVTDDVTAFGNLTVYMPDGSIMPLEGVQDINVNIPVQGVVTATITVICELSGHPTEKETSDDL